MNLIKPIRSLLRGSTFQKTAGRVRLQAQLEILALTPGELEAARDSFLAEGIPMALEQNDLALAESIFKSLGRFGSVRAVQTAETLLAEARQKNIKFLERRYKVLPPEEMQAVLTSVDGDPFLVRAIYPTITDYFRGRLKFTVSNYEKHFRRAAEQAWSRQPAAIRWNQSEQNFFHHISEYLDALWQEPA